MKQDAVVKERKSIYIVWIIPVVAMFIAGWMIYKYYDSKGYDIYVTFENGNGLVVNKTPLIYNGIKIGVITDLKLEKKDISKIIATITIDTGAGGVAKKGNVFWKVEPKVSLTKVTGLSTILSGVYIGVMPAEKDGKKLLALPDRFKFVALEQAPIDIYKSGIRFKVHADKSDIKEGAPVLFREITIGKVEEVILTKQGVDYSLYIEKKYAHLIKENSSFWKMSGVEIRASLAGLRISMDSLASVIAGGIAISSDPEAPLLSDLSKRFELYDSELKTRLNDDIITLVSNDGYNIDEKSTYIYFKGTKAGSIIDVHYNPNTDQTTFKVKLGKEFRHLANKDAYFWIVTPHIGLTSIKGLDAISRGPYISFETRSKSETMESTFTLHEESPFLKGKTIELLADQGHNLVSGINIVYHDIVIGMLKKSYISKKRKKIVFDIVIADKYKYLVNDSSSFYIQGAVEADLNFDGAYFNVGSLSSMLHSGIVLETPDLKASSGKKAFELLVNKRAYEEKAYVNNGGKFFILNTESLGSLHINSPVLYNGMPIGKLMEHKLDINSEKIELKVYIEPEYVHMINASTSFYDISGVSIKAGLSGMKIVTGSMQSILKGGIAFKTPLKQDKAALPKSFKLYADEEEIEAKYTSIELSTYQESGLKEGSDIIYKTIPIGQITKRRLKEDKLIYEVLIDEKYSYVLVDDSQFWIEDFEVDINKVRNTSALLTGAFVKVMKGRNSKTVSSFDLALKAPAKTLNKEGLRVKVKAQKLSSLKVGSPVFYRQIKIGSIEDYALSKDSKGVDLRLFIDPCYSYLVREDSLFYNATAMGMDVSLFGVKISTETISTMIHGGISMVTPENPSTPALSMHEFKLHNEPKEKWLEYNPELFNDNSSCTLGL